PRFSLIAFLRMVRQCCLLVSARGMTRWAKLERTRPRNSAPSPIRCRRVSRRSRGLVGFFAAGAVYAFHVNGVNALPLRDEPVLLFDDGARRRIAIEAAKDFARHSAIGPLRTVVVNHVKKRVFNPRCRLPCHCWFPIIVSRR